VAYTFGCPHHALFHFSCLNLGDLSMLKISTAVRSRRCCARLPAGHVDRRPPRRSARQKANSRNIPPRRAPHPEHARNDSKFHTSSRCRRKVTRRRHRRRSRSQSPAIRLSPGGVFASFGRYAKRAWIAPKPSRSSDRVRSRRQSPSVRQRPQPVRLHVGLDLPLALRCAR